MLSITARFVHDYHGVEWPPSPSRLYGALVSAMHDAESSQAIESLLLRLEAEPPPLISHGTAFPMAYDTFMPGAGKFNPSKGVGRLMRGAPAPQYSAQAGVTRWALAPGAEEVSYTWLGLELSEAERATLDDLLALIPYLGRSESAAILWVNEAMPPPTLEPGESDHPINMAVPYAGRMRDLDIAYEIQDKTARAAALHYAAYRRVGPDMAPRSAWGDMAILEQTGGYRPYVIEAALMCDAMRRAYLSIGGDDLPSMLCGHGGGDHVAWVALPNVGFEHSDGRILGYAALLPAAAPPHIMSIHEQILARMSVIYGPRGREMTFKRSLRPRVRALAADRWSKPSRAWRTVTPCVWDRYPKRGRAAKAMALMCERIGLPEPTQMSYGQRAAITGAEGARMYNANRYRGCFVAHCELTFDQPIVGPVVLGRGQHFGLGLCAPVEAESC